MELRVTALTLADAAEVLSKAGPRVTIETLEGHVARGAPTNADGTISLISYAAWLNRDITLREVPDGD